MTTLSISNRNNLHEVGEWTLLHTGDGSGSRWEAALCLSEAEVDTLSAGDAWEMVLGGEDGDEVVLQVEAGRSGLQWFAGCALVTLAARSGEPHRAPAWAKDPRSVYSLELRASNRTALSARPCVRFSMAV